MNEKIKKMFFITLVVLILTGRTTPIRTSAFAPPQTPPTATAPIRLMPPTGITPAPPAQLHPAYIFSIDLADTALGTYEILGGMRFVPTQEERLEREELYGVNMIDRFNWAVRDFIRNPIPQSEFQITEEEAAHFMAMREQVEGKVQSQLRIPFAEENATHQTVSRRIQTREFGAIDVPFLQMATTSTDLFGALNQLRPYWAQVHDAIADQQVFWCFLTQQFRQLEGSPGRQPTITHPAIVGFTSQGLPIIDPAIVGFGDMHVTGEARIRGIETVMAIENAMLRQVTINGDIYTINMEQSGNAYRVYLNRNGHNIRHLGMEWTLEPQANWGFGISVYEPTLLRVLRLDIYGQSGDGVRVHFTHQWTGVAVDGTPVAQTPPLALPETNMIETPNRVMQEIREIGIAPDSATDDMVVNVPIIIPEWFPEISPEQFPEFRQRILEQLQRDDLIVPWHELTTINIEELPRLNPMDASAPGHNIDYTRQLDEIQRQLREQNRQIQEQNRTMDEQLRTLKEIRDHTRTIGNRIGDAVIGSPGSLDFSPLEELRVFNGVFPFSIPWDLRNAFLAMFGGSVNPTPAPVFEVDLTDTIFNTRWRIDFSDFELLAIVMRWGIMALFVVGLIKTTGTLIKW
jgi:hypothetical protein